MDPRAAELIASLRRNPDDRAAYEGLKAHYARTNDYASMANLVEGWAGRLASSQHAAVALAEAGDLALYQLRDTARAGSLYEQAHARDPRNMEIVDRLLHHAETVADPALMLEALRKRGALQNERQDRPGLADTEHRIGQLYEHQYARPDKAIAHYRKAFEADPSLVAAIYAAREIYNSAGNHKASASLLDLEAQAEQDTARRVALLRELAHIRLNELSDPGGGVAALDEAVQLAPEDLAVMHELAGALLQRANQRGAGAAAEAERSRSADLMVRMAHQVPPEHAIAYCGSALDAVPAHDAALDLLEYLAHEAGRADLLPLRWVGYLQHAPSGPAADKRRRALGFAYLTAGQDADALVCLEPLAESGDVEVADTLVTLFRAAGRNEEAMRALRYGASLRPEGERVEKLHEVMQALIGEGRVKEAADCARDILAIAPGDTGALDILGKQYRDEENWAALRDLTSNAARVPGLPVDVRVARLLETASLSEEHLSDLGAAVDAHRAILALDPGHASAPASLARLLRSLERWDDLAAHLDQQALAVTDPEEKIQALRELAELHRHKRSDSAQAIAALRWILQLHPDDREARDELCDALLETDDGAAEGSVLLEARLSEADDGELKVAIAERLADTYENKLGDDVRAFDAARRVLNFAPTHMVSLDRMERIDVRHGNPSRLIETLLYRAEIVEGEERATVLTRIGTVARDQLGDLNRAADAFTRALDLAPHRGDVLDALCGVYEADNKYAQLSTLLEGRVQSETNDDGKRELLRRIARIRQDELKDPNGAIEAWQEVLKLGEDAEALRALTMSARLREADAELESCLQRLAEATDDPKESRDALFERAQVLVRMEQGDEAIVQLRRLLDTVDAGYMAAIELLASECERQADHHGLADALERKLAIVDDAGLKLPIAQRLSDLYENEVSNAERAATALYVWQECDPPEQACRQRLSKVLEELGRHEEWVACLDGLAALAVDETERNALTRQAAHIASSELGDDRGAWARLEPLIDDDEEADEQLRNLAASSGQEQALVDAYIRRATTATEPTQVRRRWKDAAASYERLDDSQRALESMLRAYATDLSDMELLAEVDRLAVACSAWKRLAQVYDRLLSTVVSPEAKVTFLMRHATLLENEAKKPSDALDRVLRACTLAPNDDSLLEEAERIAPTVGRGDELLHVYDTRKTKADTDASRVDAILRAMRLCHLKLQDAERAFQYLAQAIVLSLRSPELQEPIESAVDELDGSREATQTLAALYAQLGDDAEADPRSGAELLRRAAMIHEQRLEDVDGAFKLLKKATAMAAIPEVLDPLDAFADRHGRHIQLEAHYRALVDDAIDPSTVAELCRRHGQLLDAKLDRPGQAADVLRRLLTVQRSPEAVSLYLDALRRAGKHQDLLVALDREISKAESSDAKLALLKEAALIWQNDLKNRYEAIDAWKRVLREDRYDADAKAALEALEKNERIDTSEIMLPEAAKIDAGLGGLDENTDVPTGVVALDDDLADDGADDEGPGAENVGAGASDTDAFAALDETGTPIDEPEAVSEQDDVGAGLSDAAEDSADEAEAAPEFSPLLPDSETAEPAEPAGEPESDEDGEEARFEEIDLGETSEVALDDTPSFVDSLLDDGGDSVTAEELDTLAHEDAATGDADAASDADAANDSDALDADDAPNTAEIDIADLEEAHDDDEEDSPFDSIDPPPMPTANPFDSVDAGLDGAQFADLGEHHASTNQLEIDELEPVEPMTVLGSEEIELVDASSEMILDDDSIEEIDDLEEIEEEGAATSAPRTSVPPPPPRTSAPPPPLPKKS